MLHKVSKAKNTARRSSVKRKLKPQQINELDMKIWAVTDAEDIFLKNATYDKFKEYIKDKSKSSGLAIVTNNIARRLRTYR